METRLTHPKRGVSNIPPKWLSVLVWVGIWTLLALTFTALSYVSSATEGRPSTISYAAGMNFTRFYLWAALSPIILRFVRRYPVEFRPGKLRRVLLYISVLFLSSGVHQVMFMIIGWQFEPSLSRRFPSMVDYYRAAFLGGLYLNLLVALLLVITAHAFFFYKNYRAGEAQQAQLEAELAQAQLQALKMQLHPHFLFNALHSISSLVLEDPHKANRMIARLGDFLRLTLENTDRQLVLLEQELEFTRCYLEIEQVRFEERLQVDFEIDPGALSARVPQLILQPLVENATRHAIAPRAAPGHIKIGASREHGFLRLEVKDNGAGVNTGVCAMNKRGLGLNNVRARLRQLYGGNCRFEMANSDAGGVTVLVEIPLEPRERESD